MRHFSCDMCTKDLTPGEETRYIVQIAITPAADHPLEVTEADLDQDHIATMADMLGMLEEAGEPIEPPTLRNIEYDLCPACHTKFVADPLGRDRTRKPHFSKN